MIILGEGNQHVTCLGFARGSIAFPILLVEDLDLFIAHGDVRTITGAIEGGILDNHCLVASTIGFLDLQRRHFYRSAHQFLQLFDDELLAHDVFKTCFTDAAGVEPDNKLAIAVGIELSLLVHKKRLPTNVRDERLIINTNAECLSLL